MGQTDKALWAQVAGSSEQRWDARAQIIAHFIRLGDSVLDLGTGDQKLAKYLPPSSTYAAVDCVDTLPGTFVVDFNTEFRLPEVASNVVVCAGLFEYIVDLEGFMTRLAAACDQKTILFTYHYGRAKSNTATYRKLNHIQDADMAIDFFENYVEDLREVVRFKRQSLFSGRLAVKPPGPMRRQTRIDTALVRTMSWRQWIRP